MKYVQSALAKLLIHHLRVSLIFNRCFWRRVGFEMQKPTRAIFDGLPLFIYNILMYE